MLVSADESVEGDAHGTRTCAKTESGDESAVWLENGREGRRVVEEGLGERIRLGEQTCEHLDGLSSGLFDDREGVEVSTARVLYERRVYDSTARWVYV